MSYYDDSEGTDVSCLEDHYKHVKQDDISNPIKSFIYNLEHVKSDDWMPETPPLGTEKTSDHHSKFFLIDCGSIPTNAESQEAQGFRKLWTSFHRWEDVKVTGFEGLKLQAPRLKRIEHFVAYNRETLLQIILDTPNDDLHTRVNPEGAHPQGLEVLT